MACEGAPSGVVRMAGKHVPPGPPQQPDPSPFEGEAIWQRQFREDHEWAVARNEAAQERPDERLRNVPVYTGIRCRCRRIIYWKAEVCRVYYCVGCDTTAATCKCKELVRVPGEA